MKNLWIISIVSVVLAACGGNGSGGSAPLAELTGEQKKEVIAISSSMNDMQSVQDSKRGPQQAQPAAQVADAFVANAFVLKADSDDVETTPLSPSKDRLEKTKTHLDTSLECEVNFDGLEPSGEPGQIPEKISFSLEMGSEACGIYMLSKFNMEFAQASQTSVSMNMNFDVAFNTYGEFQKLYDVSEFKMKGGMTMTASGSETAGNMQMNGTFDGNGVSTSKGNYQFKINTNMSAASANQGNDANGYPVTTVTGSQNTEVSYVFPDYTAVLATRGTFNDEGSMDLKYFINGREVDQDDPEAMAEFENMAGGFGVPMFDPTAAQSFTQTDSTNSDVNMDL